MNTSASEFLEAVKYLTVHDTYNGVNTSFSPLGQANLLSTRISVKLENVNSSLSEGWNTTASVCKAIDEKINEVMSTLAEYMSQFSVNTIEDEMKAAEATETANATANSILGRLGLTASQPTSGAQSGSSHSEN